MKWAFFVGNSQQSTYVAKNKARLILFNFLQFFTIMYINFYKMI